MLVIHIKSLADTEDFSRLYLGLDATVLINPSKSVAKKAIIAEKDCIMLIGHGTEWGLLNPRLDGFVVDSSTVQFLKNKTIIGIWCFAGNFADRYNLQGFFTSNLISNLQEYYDVGLIDKVRPPICEQTIQMENIRFSNTINTFIRDGFPMEKWINRLQTTSSDYSFVKYNYEALYTNLPKRTC